MRRDENNLCMLYLFLRYFMNLPHGSLLSARFSEDIFNHWYWWYYGTTTRVVFAIIFFLRAKNNNNNMSSK